jgi:ATP-dependent Clp protease adaptor protein ClpS
MSQAQNTSISGDRQAATAARADRKELPTFNVVLLDDNEHTPEYVVDMLQRLFSHEYSTAKALTDAVDRTGRAIVCTTHKERAELKRDQILAHGCDYRVATCKASMRAVLEPALA